MLLSFSRFFIGSKPICFYFIICMSLVPISSKIIIIIIINILCFKKYVLLVVIFDIVNLKRAVILEVNED